MPHGSAFIMKTAKMTVNKISSPQMCQTFMAPNVGNNASRQLTGRLPMNGAPCLPDVNARKGRNRLLPRLLIEFWTRRPSLRLSSRH